MTRIARAGALLALALLTALAFAGPATAKKSRKHGKGAQTSQTLPKTWAKKHKARAAKADPDGDGLTNWGEWRSHTKPSGPTPTRTASPTPRRTSTATAWTTAPRWTPAPIRARRTPTATACPTARGRRQGRPVNAAEDLTQNHPREADTDGDGIRDGKENAGMIKASDGAIVTIALAVGGTLTAALTPTPPSPAMTRPARRTTTSSATMTSATTRSSTRTRTTSRTSSPTRSRASEDEDASVFVTASLAEEGDEDDPADEEWGGRRLRRGPGARHPGPRGGRRGRRLRELELVLEG